MLIEEIVRSCANDRVAQAAVASIGRTFMAEVQKRAASYEMSVGAYTSLAVTRFLRQGAEDEMRSVRDAMTGSQEPLLAGLHRILCITLASGSELYDARPMARQARIAAQYWRMETHKFRDLRA